MSGNECHARIKRGPSVVKRMWSMRGKCRLWQDSYGNSRYAAADLMSTSVLARGCCWTAVRVATSGMLSPRRESHSLIGAHCANPPGGPGTHSSLLTSSILLTPPILFSVLQSISSSHGDRRRDLLTGQRALVARHKGSETRPL